MMKKAVIFKAFKTALFSSAAYLNENVHARD